jgi:drug/metabolite transporter (DMT)-like permease
VTGGVAARLCLLAAIWGCSFLFIKVGLQGLSDTQVVVGRIVIGAAVLAAFTAIRRIPMPRRPTMWAHFLFLGVVGNVLPFFGFAWGEAHGAPSSLAGVYDATTPLFTLLVAVAALPSERPTVRRAAGLVLGFLGAIVILAPWQLAGGTALAGQLTCIGAAACYGVAFVYTRRFVAGSGFPPLALATGQLGCAAVVALLLTPLLAAQPASLSPKIVLSVLALGALGTGVGFVINYGLIRDVGATTASTVTYLMPVVAVILGVLVLGEPFGWTDVIGALLTLLGVAVAGGVRMARRRRGTVRSSAQYAGARTDRAERATSRH